ncbi:efflux RND transporter permease subunit [Fodinibius sp. SL11]|uniref:efflux RND transporter permease subunit n=1 Tax=Fodinibius sp. SL11 TaxID=3425690 RepID=UPI003F8858FD
METIFNRLQRILKSIIRFPISALVVSLVLSIIGLVLATNLRVDTDLSELIPDDYPSVQALQKLQEQVGAEHEVAVIIESPSLEANKAFAEALIPQALQMQQANGNPYFVRAEYRKEITFIKENALYFATDKELDQLQDYLVQKIDKAKEEANPFYFELDDEESSELDSLGNELSNLYNELIGAEYAISPDSTALAVKLFPSGSQTDLTFVRNTYSELQNLVNRIRPADFHPNMNIVLAGRLIRTLIEVQAITKDIINSFGAGALLLLVFVVLYFQYKSYRSQAGDYFSFSLMLKQFRHIPAHALIVALPMAFSLTLTFGIAWLAYQKLTIMTATLGLLLFGMGIDFGIHFFARYTEERETNSIPDALIKTFMTTGQAIAIVGITTAAAFFILMLADFKGFSEFGFIAGVGLLLSIIAYIFVLPALLVILEQIKWLNLSDHPLKKVQEDTSTPAKQQSRRNLTISYIIIAIALIITAVTVVELPNLKFEYDFAKLEPEYKEYTVLRDEMNKVYSDRKTRNAAYIIVDTPSQAIAVANQLRSHIATDTLTPTIRSVEIFQDRYREDSVAAQKQLNRINDIRELLQDPFLKDSNDPQIAQLRQAASTKSFIPLEDVPAFIKDPFTSKTGEIGTLVIIHPSVGLADGRNSILFADDVGEITIPNGQTFYAGSTSIVASDMLRLMIEETPIMVTLTILFIIIFKLIVLRKIKWMILALLPLTASFLWMFGLLEIVGWKLNFYNLVVLPTVLGIGDDSGIHLVHRYLEEGKGSIRKVLTSTGEHITVSAITTMLGFAGLLFSIHPGMRSIGEMAVLGIGLTLFAALFLLPALLTVFEQKSNIRHP